MDDPVVIGPYETKLMQRISRMEPLWDEACRRRPGARRTFVARSLNQAEDEVSYGIEPALIEALSEEVA